MRRKSSPTNRELSSALPTEPSASASHAHSVQFYGDDAFLLDGLCEFLGAALARGDAGIVVATQAHRDGLAERLKARGVDVARAASQGRYIVLGAAETLSKCSQNGQPDAASFADFIGGVIARATDAAVSEHPRVVIFGEMVALLCMDGKKDVAIRLERLWNDLAETHAFSLRCAYPMRAFGEVEDGEPLTMICAAHGHVIPAESYTSLTEENERSRSIALLQHKAQALEAELAARTRVERILSDTNRELRAAVAARDAFLSVAAHELKTPVTGLAAFAQLLLRDARRKGAIAPERLEAGLEAIEAQSEKLTQLVGSLLDIAQIEAGSLRIEPKGSDLAGIIRSALERRQEHANFTFHFHGPDDLQAVVDPVRFEQAMSNLLDNAVKFSPDGGLVLVELGQDHDGAIRLCVTDQGVGIPSEQREAVFDRFHQAHNERHLSGMGLGLYLAREIIELHGGSVRVEEPEQGGTRIVVALPPSVRGARTGSAA